MTRRTILVSDRTASDTGIGVPLILPAAAQPYEVMTVLTALPASTPAQRRELVTAIPGPRSVELGRRRQTAVAAGVSSLLPVYAARAAGGVLVDVDGNSLIDFGSGIAVTTVGNSAPEVVERVHDQADRFTHTCFTITPYEGYVAVCEQLNRLTPGGHGKRSALFNSGAEAIENAVKIARLVSRRQAIVVFDHGYHGRTNLTMALTAKEMPYKRGFGPFAPEVYRVPMAYPYRWPTGPERCCEEAAQGLRYALDKQIGAESVAAVLIEPIQGEGGFVVPPDGFLAQVAEICRERGILLIADEVQTGFCRTGDWFASEHDRVVPDLIATAKGIAGGLPLAGVTGRAEIMDAVHPGGLGGTYGGNPLACAAALGAIQTMETQRLADRARQIGEVILPRLRALQERHPAVGDVRGRGAMLAVELIRPGGREPDPGLTAAIATACHQSGLIVLTAGTYGNVLRFLPPLVIPEDLLLEGLDLLDQAFDAVPAA